MSQGCRRHRKKILIFLESSDKTDICVRYLSSGNLSWGRKKDFSKPTVLRFICSFHHFHNQCVFEMTHRQSKTLNIYFSLSNTDIYRPKLVIKNIIWQCDFFWKPWVIPTVGGGGGGGQLPPCGRPWMPYNAIGRIRVFLLVPLWKKFESFDTLKAL